MQDKLSFILGRFTKGKVRKIIWYIYKFVCYIISFIIYVKIIRIALSGLINLWKFRMLFLNINLFMSNLLKIWWFKYKIKFRLVNFFDISFLWFYYFILNLYFIYSIFVFFFFKKFLINYIVCFINTYLNLN
jgi:hypothetical protein